MILTGCDDFSRESKEYWDKRLFEMWHLPFHGMFLDKEDIIKKMDSINFEIMKQHMNQFGDETANVLECACGDGRYVTDMFVNFGFRIRKYIGIDFGTRNIIEAKLRNETENVNFYEMDVMNVKLKFQMKFHMIFMVSALSSIERNYRKILNDLKSMLTEDGKLFIFEQDFYMVHWK